MKEKVYAVLDELGIEYEVVNHPPLFTADDDEKYGIEFNGTICKCLFLRNKNKSKYYVYAMPLDKRADIKAIGERLGESKMSFGSEEALEEKLHIKSGAVSVFNVVEVPKTDVIFVMDEDVLKCDKVGFHPNDNTATVLLAPKDIEKIWQKYDIDTSFNFVKI